MISFCTSVISAGSSATPAVTASSSAFCAGAISDVVPEEAELEEAVLDVSVPPDPEEAVPDAVLPFGVTFTSSKVPPVPAF